MSGTPNEVDGGVVDALLLKRPWRSSYKSSLVRNDDDGESGTDWAGDMRSWSIQPVNILLEFLLTL
jgi:hypothetical protein